MFVHGLGAAECEPPGCHTLGGVLLDVVMAVTVRGKLTCPFPLLLSLSRFPPQRDGNGTGNCDRTRDDLQGGHQLRPLQNHLSDMRLREQGHFLLCPCCGAFTVQDPQAGPGETPSSHLRDPFPDEQGPAPEVCSVFDHGAPHRGAAHRPEVG